MGAPYIYDNSGLRVNGTVQAEEFGNRVLAKAYRPNSEKVRGKWRKLHK